MEGIAWEWQSIDGCMNKAPMAKESSGRNPTDRGKIRNKTPYPCGWAWRPIIGRRHRAQPAWRQSVESSFGKYIAKPIMEAEPENLCADVGYAGEVPRKAIIEAGYEPHVRPRREEQREEVKNPAFKARRWVVEACHSCFNRFCKLTIRHEKREATRLAWIHLAAAIIALRKITPKIIYG